MHNSSPKMKKKSISTSSPKLKSKSTVKSKQKEIQQCRPLDPSLQPDVDEPPTHLFRIAIWGGKAEPQETPIHVGKTSLAHHIMKEDEENVMRKDTPGHYLIIKKMNNIVFKLQILDLNDTPRQRIKRTTFNMGLQQCLHLVMFDISQRESFELMRTRWVMEILLANPDVDNSIIILGNCSDKEGAREVSYNEGKGYAEDNGFRYYEISAKSGQGVDEMLQMEVGNQIRLFGPDNHHWKNESKNDSSKNYRSDEKDDQDGFRSSQITSFAAPSLLPPPSQLQHVEVDVEKQTKRKKKCTLL